MGKRRGKYKAHLMSSFFWKLFWCAKSGNINHNSFERVIKNWKIANKFLGNNKANERKMDITPEEIYL